jgi:hypothetical protein
MLFPVRADQVCKLLLNLLYGRRDGLRLLSIKLNGINPLYKLIETGLFNLYIIALYLKLANDLAFCQVLMYT